jgi:hypothetical protein
MIVSDYNKHILWIIFSILTTFSVFKESLAWSKLVPFFEQNIQT